MKLLILTQKVDKNDPILGFFHRWIEEFAKHAESVSVICLYKGEYDLPINVKVYSLGKENGATKFEYIKNFYKYIWSLRHEYDYVFVHMNQIYILLGGLFWIIEGKKVVLWYVHRAKSFSLYLAEKLVDRVLTSSKESFRIKSNKVVYVGHGVDTKLFPTLSYNLESREILTVGRITQIKNLETFIDAAKSMPAYKFIIIGDAITDKDKNYEKKLKEESAIVTFKSSVPPSILSNIFQNTVATVNLSPTGGMDKTVLESLVSGRPAFVTNEAFKDLFGEYWNIFSYAREDSNMLVKKINDFLELPDEKKLFIINELERKVRIEYSVEALIKKIILKLV